FSKILNASDRDLNSAYRSTVPVQDWYAFKDDIERMRESAQPDVLWPGTVRDFAQTSGTTAGDKYIPVSREMLRSNVRASLDIFANLINQAQRPSRLMSGKFLFLGGTRNFDTSPQGIRTGDLSGLVTPLIRWPISRVY